MDSWTDLYAQRNLLRCAPAHILDRCVVQIIIIRRQLDFLKCFLFSTSFFAALCHRLRFIRFSSLRFVIDYYSNVFIDYQTMALRIYGVYSCTLRVFSLAHCIEWSLYTRIVYSSCVFADRRCGLLWQRVGDRDTGNGSEGYIFYARTIAIETRTNMNETRRPQWRRRRHEIN